MCLNLIVVFLVLLVITIISINVIWGKENNSNNKKTEQEGYKVLAQEINESITNKHYV